MMSFQRIFEVGENDDRHVTDEEAVKIAQHVNSAQTLVWTMSEADLAELESAIGAYRRSKK